MYTLEIFTSDDDESTGGDWTIYKHGKPIYFEGDDMKMTIGEVKVFLATLNRVGDCSEW